MTSPTPDPHFAFRIPQSLTLLILLAVLTACGGGTQPAANSSAAPALDAEALELSRKKDRLTRFFQPMRVREGDWLESHPEDGETFEQYIASGPTLPTKERRTIYIQPVGEFSKQQAEVVELTAEYMRGFFNLPVTLRKTMPLKDISPEMVRVQWPDNMQIRTTYFIDDMLPKLLPADGAALICLTSYDLYPGGTWNYVFGQASLDGRVGVWSLWRLAQDGDKRASRELLLARTLKIAMHETGHMFSMRHCTKYECLMSGTNHIEETDRHPIDTCPECSAKIEWAMKYPLDERFKNLAEFWRKQGRASEQRLMMEKADAVCKSCMPKRQ